MKRTVSSSIASTIAALCAAAAHAATPSVNGANIFAHHAIIDAQENTWTIVSGVVERNQIPVGNGADVNFLLELNSGIYQRNGAGEWDEWTGSTWAATTDPRIVSASGTRIGVGSGVLIDATQHVWTLPANEYAYRDGYRADGNYNTVAVVYYDGIIYCANTGNEWYSWTGTSWTRVAGDPVAASPPNTGAPQGPSANGASIGVGAASLVDGAGNQWTLPSNEYAYVNGVRAGGNYDTIEVLYFGGVIYCENTGGEWYSWTGSVWKKVPGNPEASPGSSPDPRGPHLAQYATYTSPVCPASQPGCTPQFIGNASVTFTKATTAGNSIWVAATVSDYGGTHAISVTDSQHNVYRALGQVNDQRPGAQSLAQFYAENVQGGADTITVNWTSDNYKGVVAAEIAGVTGTSLVGNSVDIQDGNLAAATDNVTSHGIAVGVGSTPSLIIALTMDTNGGGSDTGGSGYCAVAPGSGFTAVTALWNWSPAGQPACNLATLETITVGAAGTVAGTFTSPHLADPYVTAAAAFH